MLGAKGLQWSRSDRRVSQAQRESGSPITTSVSKWPSHRGAHKLGRAVRWWGWPVLSVSQGDGMRRLLCHLAPSANAPLLFPQVTLGSGKQGWVQGQPWMCAAGPGVPTGVTPLLLHEVRITANLPSACGAQSTGLRAWGSLCSRVAALAGCSAPQW